MVKPIKTPKNGGKGSARWYNYYAGYSDAFVEDVFNRLYLDSDSLVLDPWNGSGTTSSVAERRGYRVSGFDLNPAMIVVAASRRIDQTIEDSLLSISREIIYRSKDFEDSRHDEPLSRWFYPSASSIVRSVELAIQKVVSDVEYSSTSPSISAIERIPPLAAFFYVALFRAVRELLHPFRSSNPAWIRTPKSSMSRLRPSRGQVHRLFVSSVEDLRGRLSIPGDRAKSDVYLRVADSRSLPLETGSVRAVVTSPPYCTRLDYVVATLPELAVLGYGEKSQIDSLRCKMLGTPTVKGASSEPGPFASPIAERVLSSIRKHASKASSGYYLKTYRQYFSGLENSLSEISRVMQRDGDLVMVVQDSYYKDIHVDLAHIVIEMSNQSGFVLSDRVDFLSTRNMARVNQASKAYRRESKAVESALFFTKA